MADDLRTVAMNALPNALENLARVNPAAALAWIDEHMKSPPAPDLAPWPGLTDLPSSASTDEVRVRVRAVLVADQTPTGLGDLAVRDPVGMPRVED